MGTISSTLPSTNAANTPVTTASGSSSSSSTMFTGGSAYSQDLQNVISRAVSIASMPIALLTSQQNTLSNQSNELDTLSTDFTAVQTSIQAIQDAMGGSGMDTNVSDPSVASVTVGDGAVQGAYSINVSSIGVYATSLSSQSWNAASPSGTPSTYSLVVGANRYTITPSDNSAATVASTINAQFGNMVQATAVNVGSTASPDYRLSLQSASLGPMDLDIQIPAQASLQSASSTTAGYALSQTANTWDSSGSVSTYTLAVDGTSYTISPTDNSAASVAAAINAISGNPVNATVVDMGTGGTPDERIQLQSTSPDVSTVNLQDSWGNSLQQQETSVAAGAGVSQTSWTWDPTADSSGDATTYTLSAAGVTQTFSVTDNSAESVAAAINALSGSPVTANVLDMGTANRPDYRIQLVDNTGSAASPQLTRSTPFSMQTQGNPPGSPAEYEVANSGKSISSDSRSVSLATGTTLTLTGTGETDVTVTQSISTLSTALSGFADAYNAAVGELAKQYGQQNGPLQGENIIYSLSHALSSVSTYYSSAAGSLGMTDLGMTLNVNGTLTYSPLSLMGTDLGNSAGVVAFLGSTTGGGFLQAATNAMATVADPITGLLKTTETAAQSQITRIGDTIATKQAAVQQLQTTLTNQIAKADAAIATMQQEYSYLSSMFAAQQTADLMYSKS